MSKRKSIKKYIERDVRSGTFYVILYWGKESITGRIIKSYKTAETLEQAEDILREFQTSKSKGELDFDLKVRMELYCKSWIKKEKKMAQQKKLQNQPLEREETTLGAYENIINNHIIPYLGKYELNKIIYKDIEDYFTYMSSEKNLSNTTLNKHKAVLSVIFEQAIKEERMSKNLAKLFKEFKQSEPRILYYDSIEECKILLKKVQGHNLEIAICLALFCGLRREEVNGLKWKNIDLDQGYLRIEEVVTAVGAKVVKKGPKSSTSRRSLKIPKYVVEVLNKIKNKQEENKKELKDSYEDNDLVFCKDNGKPFRPNYISSEVLRFVKKQDISAITFHGLRHTFATILYKEGESIKDISCALGHNSEKVTKKYIHNTDKVHEDAISTMDNLFTNQ